MTWNCGTDGNWLDFPDFTNCYNLDITEPLNDLEQPDSVPSTVVEQFYSTVTSEQDLAAGDLNQILRVMDKAIEVQKIEEIMIFEHSSEAHTFYRLKDKDFPAKLTKTAMRTSSRWRESSCWTRPCGGHHPG